MRDDVIRRATHRALRSDRGRQAAKAALLYVRGQGAPHEATRRHTPLDATPVIPAANGPRYRAAKQGLRRATETAGDPQLQIRSIRPDSLGRVLRAGNRPAGQSV